MVAKTPVAVALLLIVVTLVSVFCGMIGYVGNYRVKSAPLLLQTDTVIRSDTSALLLLEGPLESGNRLLEILDAAQDIRYQDVHVRDVLSTRTVLLDGSKVEHRKWTYGDSYQVPGDPSIYVVLLPVVPLDAERKMQNGELYVLVRETTCVEASLTSEATIHAYCETTTRESWKHALDCGWLKLFVTETGDVYYGGMEITIQTQTIQSFSISAVGTIHPTTTPHVYVTTTQATTLAHGLVWTNAFSYRIGDVVIIYVPVRGFETGQWVEIMKPDGSEVRITLYPYQQTVPYTIEDGSPVGLYKVELWNQASPKQAEFVALCLFDVVTAGIEPRPVGQIVEVTAEVASVSKESYAVKTVLVVVKANSVFKPGDIVEVTFTGIGGVSTWRAYQLKSGDLIRMIIRYVENSYWEARDTDWSMASR
jgi:hypothetical protein